MVNENYERRKPTARAKAAEMIKLDTHGLQRTEIARRTGIGVASVYRALADAKRVAHDRKVAA
jgi:DNA invertase Pin-like site-specific DNA recombinase